MSLLFSADLITKSEVSLLNLPNSVPPSFNNISAPSTSRIKSLWELNSVPINLPLALILPDAVIWPVIFWSPIKLFEPVVA